MTLVASQFPAEWLCSACGREFPTLPPSMCPGCGVIGAFSRADGAGELGGGGAAPLRSLAERAPTLRIIPTGLAPVDRLLGGFPPGTATTIYGARGTGKSTIALQIAGGLAERFRSTALVVCPEMSGELLRRTAGRVTVGLGRLYPSAEPGEWEAEANELGARVLLIDSVSRFPRPVETLHAAIEWARAARGVALLLTHQSRRGKPLGAVALEHDTDCVLRVTLRGKRRTLAIDGKCRWAALGAPVEI